MFSHCLMYSGFDEGSARIDTIAVLMCADMYCMLEWIKKVYLWVTQIDTGFKISIYVQIEISLDEHPPESSSVSYAYAMSTSDIKFTSEDHNNRILVREMAGLTKVSQYLSRGHISLQAGCSLWKTMFTQRCGWWLSIVLEPSHRTAGSYHTLRQVRPDTV